MSELLESIQEAQSRLNDIESAVNDIASNLATAEQLADAADSSSIQDVVNDLEEALSQLSRAEDYIPTQYTEVGAVGDMGESLESYIGDATQAVENAKDALENLL